MTPEQSKLIAEAVVNSILNKGLAVSTFRDKFPDAYRELLEYRLDMACDVERVLRRMKIL